MTTRTHNPYSATKWYDRSSRVFYVGMERNGSLIQLDGVPGFEMYAGYSGADCGSKSEQAHDFVNMQAAAIILNNEFNGIKS